MKRVLKISHYRHTFDYSIKYPSWCCMFDVVRITHFNFVSDVLPNSPKDLPSPSSSLSSSLSSLDLTRLQRQMSSPGLPCDPRSFRHNCPSYEECTRIDYDDYSCTCMEGYMRDESTQACTGIQHFIIMWWRLTDMIWLTRPQITRRPRRPLPPCPANWPWCPLAKKNNQGHNGRALFSQLSAVIVK